MEFHLAENLEENCQHDHIPFILIEMNGVEIKSIPLQLNKVRFSWNFYFYKSNRFLLLSEQKES